MDTSGKSPSKYPSLKELGFTFSKKDPKSKFTKKKNGEKEYLCCGSVRFIILSRDVFICWKCNSVARKGGTKGGRKIRIINYKDGYAERQLRNWPIDQEAILRLECDFNLGLNHIEGCDVTKKKKKKSNNNNNNKMMRKNIPQRNSFSPPQLPQQQQQQQRSIIIDRVSSSAQQQPQPYQNIIPPPLPPRTRTTSENRNENNNNNINAKIPILPFSNTSLRFSNFGFSSNNNCNNNNNNNNNRSKEGFRSDLVHPPPQVQQRRQREEVERDVSMNPPNFVPSGNTHTVRKKRKLGTAVDPNTPFKILFVHEDNGKVSSNKWVEIYFSLGNRDSRSRLLQNRQVSLDIWFGEKKVQFKDDVSLVSEEKLKYFKKDISEKFYDEILKDLNLKIGVGVPRRATAGKVNVGMILYTTNEDKVGDEKKKAYTYNVFKHDSSHKTTILVTEGEEEGGEEDEDKLEHEVSSKDEHIGPLIRQDFLDENDILRQPILCGTDETLFDFSKRQLIREDKCDEFGGNALLFATAQGLFDHVKYFVEFRKFDPNRKDIIGDTPLDIARHFGKEKLIEFFVSKWRDYGERGITFHKNREYWKALEYLNISLELVEEAKEDDKDDLYVAKLLSKRGDLYSRCHMMKDNEKAISDFSKAIGLDPESVDSYCGRGYVYGRDEKFSGAWKCVEEALKIAKKMGNNNTIELANCYREMSLLNDLQGKYEDSLIDIDEAIKINPQFSDAYRIRADHYCDRKKNYQKAKDDYNKSIRLDPKYEVPYRNRSWMNSIRDNHEKAFKDIEMAIMLAEDYYYVYCDRGFLYRDLGNHEKAAADFKKAFEIARSINPVDSPSQIYYLCNLADSIADLSRKLSEKKADSVKCFRMAENCCSNNSEVNYVWEQEFISYIRKGWDYEESLVIYYRIFRLQEADDTIKKLDKILDYSRKYVVEGGPEKKERKYFLRSLEKARKKLEEPRHEEQMKDVGSFQERFEPGEGNSVLKNSKKMIDESLAEDLKNKKKESSLEFEKLRILRLINRGGFGHVYLCQFPDIGGIFAVKILKDLFDSYEVRKRIIDRDCVVYGDQQKMKNVVSILGFKYTQKIFISKFPQDDIENYWIGTLGYTLQESFTSGYIIMKYYPMDLGMYLRSRLTNPKPGPLSSLEVCLILEQLLNGIKFLQEVYVVHRDLHPGNIFVHWEKGKLWIADFGDSLKFENKKFETKHSDATMKHYLTSVSTHRAGGSIYRLPPEVILAKDGQNVDYSKCDVFSAGMIAYGLFSRFKNGKCDPFQMEKEKENEEREEEEEGEEGEEGEEEEELRAWFHKRGQEDYVHLDETYNCDVDLGNLIQKMLVLDNKHRIAAKDAHKLVRVILKKLKEMKDN